MSVYFFVFIHQLIKTFYFYDAFEKHSEVSFCHFKQWSSLVDNEFWMQKINLTFIKLLNHQP